MDNSLPSRFQNMSLSDVRKSTSRPTSTSRSTSMSTSRPTSTTRSTSRPSSTSRNINKDFDQNINNTNTTINTNNNINNNNTNNNISTSKYSEDEIYEEENNNNTMANYTLNDLDDLYSLWNIRCSCNKVVGKYQVKYENLIKEGYTPEDALNELGLLRTCCRRTALTPGFIEKGRAYTGRSYGASDKDPNTSGIIREYKAR